MAERAHVTLNGDIAGRYVVEEARPDGRLILAPEPEPTLDEVCAEEGLRPITAAEFDQYFGHLPSDGEG